MVRTCTIRHRLDKKSRLVIPPECRIALGLKPGDLLEFHIDRNKFYVAKARDIVPYDPNGYGRRLKAHYEKEMMKNGIIAKKQENDG